MKWFFRASILAAAISLAGCASDDKPPPANPDPGQPQAKLLSNLNAVSATPVDPLAIDSVPAPGEGLLRDDAPATAGPRTYEADPGVSREVGNERNPGTVRLLNGKAAQFGSFCAVILDRVYARLSVAEKSDEFSETKLPTEIKPVIVTAIMDKQGKLTELILEQHSGKAKVDKLMLEVCKKGIWYENPPVGALSDDGTYKLTLKLKLENYASLDEHHWTFVTDLALGLS